MTWRFLPLVGAVLFAGRISLVAYVGGLQKRLDASKDAD
jgi:hypothetical protein